VVGGKRVSVTREDEVEDMLHKMCSKLIHPTAMLLNNFDEMLYNKDSYAIFAGCILQKAWTIIETFHNLRVVA
jgi:hypothetical protein